MIADDMGCLVLLSAQLLVTSQIGLRPGTKCKAHLASRGWCTDAVVSIDPTTAARASTCPFFAALAARKAAGAEEPKGAVSSEMSDSRENGDRPASSLKLSNLDFQRTLACKRMRYTENHIALLERLLLAVCQVDLAAAVSNLRSLLGHGSENWHGKATDPLMRR